MIANEFVEHILQIRKEGKNSKVISETHAYDLATLVSEQFIIPLFFRLQRYGFDMIDLKQHIEALYDSGNHFGLVYFIYILADGSDMTVPIIFTEMCANDMFVPILSEAIICDWLDLNLTDDYYDNV